MWQHSIIVATFVVNWEKDCLFINRYTFLWNCLTPHLNLLSPHVANGHKVGQRWSRHWNINSAFVFTKTQALSVGISFSTSLNVAVNDFAHESFLHGNFTIDMALNNLYPPEGVKSSTKTQSEFWPHPPIMSRGLWLTLFIIHLCGIKTGFCSQGFIFSNFFFGTGNLFEFSYNLQISFSV